MTLIRLSNLWGPFLRAVVASLRRAGRGWGRVWADPGLVSNAKLWVDDVQSARAIFTGGYAYYEVTHESLMADPVQGLMQVFRFLNLPETEESCTLYVNQCQRDKLRDGLAKGTAWDTGNEPFGFFGTAELDRWTKELTASDVTLVEDITFPFAEQFGYKRVQHPRHFHIRAEAHTLMDKVAKRIAWRYSRLKARL